MKHVLLSLLLSTVAFAKPSPGSHASVDHVIALVDGRPIWHSQVEEVYERAKLDKPSFDQTQQVIDSLIANAIIENTAEKMHVTVTESEIDQAIAMVKQQNNIDDAGLDKALAEQHFTRASYRDEVARQIRMGRVFNQDFAAKIQISDDDIKAAYELVKKMDATIGPLEKEREKIRGMVFEQKMQVAQEAWIKQQMALAHIEKR
ncbi:MAG: SurA N-terminal domain-containing protein [Kofleriaceae bacterium]